MTESFFKNTNEKNNLDNLSINCEINDTPFVVADIKSNEKGGEEYTKNNIVIDENGKVKEVGTEYANSNLKQGERIIKKNENYSSLYDILFKVKPTEKKNKEITTDEMTNLYNSFVVDYIKKNNICYMPVYSDYKGNISLEKKVGVNNIVSIITKEDDNKFNIFQRHSEPSKQIGFIGNEGNTANILKSLEGLKQEILRGINKDNENDIIEINIFNPNREDEHEHWVALKTAFTIKKKVLVRLIEKVEIAKEEEKKANAVNIFKDCHRIDILQSAKIENINGKKVTKENITKKNNYGFTLKELDEEEKKYREKSEKLFTIYKNLFNKHTKQIITGSPNIPKNYDCKHCGLCALKEIEETLRIQKNEKLVSNIRELLNKELGADVVILNFSVEELEKFSKISIENNEEIVDLITTSTKKNSSLKDIKKILNDYLKEEKQEQKTAIDDELREVYLEAGISEETINNSREEELWNMLITIIDENSKKLAEENNRNLTIYELMCDNFGAEEVNKSCNRDELKRYKNAIITNEEDKAEITSWINFVIKKDKKWLNLKRHLNLLIKNSNEKKNQNNTKIYGEVPKEINKPVQTITSDEKRLNNNGQFESKRRRILTQKSRISPLVEQSINTL